MGRQIIPAVESFDADTATVSVSGVGEVAVAPERAVVFVQIAAQDADPETAASQNGALRASVLEELASIGYDAAQVSLWGYAAGPPDGRNRIPPSVGGTNRGFQTISGIRVIVEPVDRLDEVVSAVLRAGANGIPLVQFESGGSDEARQAAARMAVTRARVAAESVADAAGGRLGDLVNLAIVPDYNTLFAATRVIQSGIIGQGLQLYPSNVTVRAQVQATWVFEQR